MRQFFIPSFCLTLSLALYTQASFAETGPVMPEHGLGKVILTLCFILFLIYGLAWYFKKHTGLNPILNGHIKTLAIHHLGQKEKIVIVDVAGEQLLLGVTGQNIQLLKSLENPIDIEKESTQSNDLFAKTFKQLLSKHQDKSDSDLNKAGSNE